MSSSSSSSCSSSSSAFSIPISIRAPSRFVLPTDLINCSIVYLNSEDRSELIQVSRQFYHVFFTLTFKRDSLPENHRHLATIFVQLMSVNGFTQTLGSIYDIAYRKANLCTRGCNKPLLEKRSVIFYRQLMEKYKNDLLERIMEHFTTKNLEIINNYIKTNGHDFSPEKLIPAVSRSPSIPPKLQIVLINQLAWSLAWYRNMKSTIFPDGYITSNRAKRYLKTPSPAPQSTQPNLSPSPTPSSQTGFSQLPTQQLSQPFDEEKEPPEKKLKEKK